MVARPSFFLLVLFALRAFSQTSTPAASVASQYSLSTSTTIPFPQATLGNSDAQSFITNNWGLSKGRIQNGAQNLVFVDDPFPNAPAPGSTSSSTSGPVLQVQYPAGSFQSNNEGGAQMYAIWNSSGSAFESMLITYEVAFDAGFDWVKGGKLPGLRGGPDPNNCSGGNQANGKNCFSSRVMWRTNGAGEVYAYVPRDNNICNEDNVLCNDEFGISLDRGSFAFSSGKWNRVTMLVRLNSPDQIANGQVILYFNDVWALSHNDIVYRSSDVITTGGLYFSTFFGGSDPSWAPQALTHTYFRNFQLFAGTSPSNLQGSPVTSDAQGRMQTSFAGTIVTAFSALLGLFI
ncbi:polysaccharide lyase family 14 protein [Russula earlei]|uniref:Polysaccharide lyase family 14 protein n=1 Tax=Russula earlei TaxID=71964 RepID=A0ACC0U2A0_9AGAM|nr:polysaccharide lyase family 14 protein [Russula earlei]